MFTSQPAISASHWYLFCLLFCIFLLIFLAFYVYLSASHLNQPLVCFFLLYVRFFLYVFCSLFLPFYVHFSASHLSQPLVCFFFFYVRFFAYFLLIFLYFFSASHLSQPSNHPLSHYIDLLLLFTIFLTLQLHVCKYVDSKC